MAVDRGNQYGLCREGVGLMELTEGDNRFVLASFPDEVIVHQGVQDTAVTAAFETFLDKGNVHQLQVDKAVVLGSILDDGNVHQLQVDKAVVLGSILDDGNVHQLQVDKAVVLGSILDDGNVHQLQVDKAVVLGSILDDGNDYVHHHGNKAVDVFVSFPDEATVDQEDKAVAFESFLDNVIVHV